MCTHAALDRFLMSKEYRLQHIYTTEHFVTNTQTNHHNRFTALFRDHPGELVPEKNFWTLWCKGRLTEADTLTIRLGISIQTNQCLPPPSPHIFYRPDALPAAQGTASKH